MTARTGIGLATLAVAFLAVGVAGPAAAVPPGWTVERVHDGLTFPLALRFAPDARLFVLGRRGSILICGDSGRAAPVEWATVPAIAVEESGLLGLDLHPDFPDSPYVYVFHTDTTRTPRSVVARLVEAGGQGAGYALLREIPRLALLHQGGRIAFGPDRMLVVAVGDQGHADLVFSLTNPWGKLLRLTPLGEPAPGNPWPEHPTIAAIGVRNVFGLCFDPLDGTGYFTENGGGCGDELNRIVPGADYGWPFPSACTPAAGTQPPLATMVPEKAATGCCLVRGAAGGLDGDLFFGNWGDRTLRRAYLHAGSPPAVDSVVVFHVFDPGHRVLDVAVGPDAVLWVCTSDGFSTGAIWRLVPPSPVSVASVAAPGPLVATPNPFTRSVSLRLPPEAVVERLEVLDSSGRLVRRWWRPRGTVSWDGRDRSGAAVVAGVYFVRAIGPAGAVTRGVVRLTP